MERHEEDMLRDVVLRNANSILLARQRAEAELLDTKEALRQNAERLQAMFNQAAVGIAVADLDGRLVEVNPKFAQVVGYSADELMSRTFVDITHPDDVQRTQEYSGRLIRGEIGDYVYEKRYLRKDGTAVWSRSSVALLRNASGEPQRFLGVIEDITARKEAEEALQDETRVLEILNQTGTMLASQLDVQSLLQAVTDAATDLSGAKFGAFFYNTTDENGDAFMLYTLSGAPREAFEKFGHPRATQLFGHTFNGEGPLRIADVTKDHRYGRMAPHYGMPRGHLPVCSYLAVPVISRSGETIGGLFFGHTEPGVFTERSERLIVGIAAQAAVAIDNARLYVAAQRAAADRESLLESERFARTEAERMSAMKDEFLATLSHELRTPLSAILGWAQVLRYSATDPDLAKGLETIERNARIQKQLIEDLLDMSRITSGKLRLDIQPVQPVAFVEAAIETIRPAANAKGIRLETILDPTAGPVSGDPQRLQQVIWNLLSNAIKFTPKDGKVQVVLERVNSHIEIAVADTGVGIEPEFLGHAFDRFRQADGSSTRQHGGLGLGLSIVRHLVELHGGTARIASLGVGQGTTVTVELPLKVVHTQRPSGTPRMHPASPPAASYDYRATDLEGIRVVVIDDQADARELVARVLSECGAEVTSSDDAAETLRLVETIRPDVLISDIGMPRVDGFELLRRVRALGASRGGMLPAIALTAFARTEDRTRALRAGFLMHIAKPVEAAELIASVASITGRTGEG
jgi:PAS domain S-box-containing protein